MSDAGENGDMSLNQSLSRSNNKRRIVMRVESDDSDSSESSEDNFVRTSCNFRKRQPVTKLVISDGNDCSRKTTNNSTTLAEDFNKFEQLPTANNDVDGFTTDSSNDESFEKCPICLLSLRNQEIGSPSICEHLFCRLCIEEWSKNMTTCPIDRHKFKSIIVRDSFKTMKFVCEIKVDEDKIERNDLLPDENDLTFCEICDQSNREDVMLLCDGCNAGYHMDCITPVLTEIPEGYWYCVNCNEFEENEDLNLVYEDLRDLGIPQTQLRVQELRQPRILRTSQNERLRANILSRTTSNRVILNSGVSMAFPSTSNRQKKSTKKNKTLRRRRMPRRRRTYVVEYDVNNYDEKFQIKTTKRVIKKRNCGKAKNRKAKVHRGKKTKKCTGKVKISISSKSERSLFSSQSFSLFANPNELEYFTDSDDRTTVDVNYGIGNGSTGVQTLIRLPNVGSFRRRKSIISNLDRPSTDFGGSDLLSNIMDLQDRWYNVSRRGQLNSIHIGTDGILNFESEASFIHNEPKQSTKNSDSNIKTAVIPGSVYEAPTYPRNSNQSYTGVGGSNYSQKYNNKSSEYRSSGGSGRNNTNSGYNRTSGNFNSFQFDSSLQNASGSQSIHNLNNQGSGIRGIQDSRGRFQNQDQNFSKKKTDDVNYHKNEGSNENSKNSNASTSQSSAELSSNIEPLKSENSNVPQQIGIERSNTGTVGNIPPLPPPPWNKNLFQLTGDYAEEDDDADCPNFSVYSAESFQVAGITDALDTGQSSENKIQEDEFDEKEEDLVQLDDDDDAPDISVELSVSENTSEVIKQDGEIDNLENICCSSSNEQVDDKYKKGNETAFFGNNSNENHDENEVIVDNSVLQDVKCKTTGEIPTNKKVILELYDDSDWEEWNIGKPESSKSINSKVGDGAEKGVNKNCDNENKPNEKENLEESISEEEDRSYTPCLDEKNEPNFELWDDKMKNKSFEKEKIESDRADVSTLVIDGMETELISDEDEDILRKEQTPGKRNGGKNKEKASNEKKFRKEQFKKISKNTKERNYRDRDRRFRRDRSKSHSNNKENRNRPNTYYKGRNKRKDIERYNVRNVIGQPRTYKDRYGRDTSRPRQITSRSRSNSRKQTSNSRSESVLRSLSSRENDRSFTMSPSPVSYGRSLSRRTYSARKSKTPFCRTSRSYNRDPRKSRTPIRLRARSNSRVCQNGKRMTKYKRPSLSISSESRSRSQSRSLSRTFTPKRKSDSRSLSHNKNKPARSKDKKKNNKKRASNATPSPRKRSRHMLEDSGTLTTTRKKKQHTCTKSPVQTQTHTWSTSPERPPPPVVEELSWTPPLIAANAENLTVIVENKESPIVSSIKRKREKKRKTEKRREQTYKKGKRKSRNEICNSPIAPSKEVFASGDNILVSVSFNKEIILQPQKQTTVVTLPPTRGEIVTKQRSSDRLTKKPKKAKEKLQRRHKKSNAKPVAIIDLDRSPFQEITQSPRDIIILTDSDREDHNINENEKKINSEIEVVQNVENSLQLDKIENSSNNERLDNLEDVSFEIQQLGPKTPPEPSIIKFTLPLKNKQIKTKNPLHDEAEEIQNKLIEDNQEHEMSALNKIGPNTPPESGPCSPDVYDPFDPTKSPSVSPSRQSLNEIPLLISEKETNFSESISENRETRATTQETNINPVELVMALMNSKSNLAQDMCAEATFIATNDICDDKKEDNIPKSINVLSNVVITPSKSQQRSLNLPEIRSPVSVKSHSTGATDIPKAKTGNNRHIGGNSIDGDNEIVSPYSPGSDDYEDLFEPPTDLSTVGLNSTSGNCMPHLSSQPRISKEQSLEIGLNVNSNNCNKNRNNNNINNNNNKSNNNNNKNTSNTNNSNSKSNKAVFDNLFGTSPVSGQIKIQNFFGGRKQRSSSSKPIKKTPVKVTKVSTGLSKMDEDQIKILDELPSSAVELQVKDKFLRKLNRQERVVEEVKLVLKPHYNKKYISKEDYKEILRRSVPKICHSKSGEINPHKIKNLIEAYVKKFRQRNKLGIVGSGQVSSAVKCAAYLKKL